MKKTLIFAVVLLFLCSFLGTANALTVSATSDAGTLVSNILGTGVSLVGGPSLTGVANQQGTFSSGLAEVGFGSGVVLTSGNATSLPARIPVKQLKREALALSTTISALTLVLPGKPI